MKLPLQLNRRTLLIIGICAGVLLVIAIIASLTQTAGKYKVSDPFASNIVFPQQMSGDTVYYFSGSAFISYDLSTHKTKPLTPIYSLPTDISAVAWSGGGALFNAGGYSEVDQLYPILVRKGLATSGYYWWLVNFKTGQISLIGNPATNADVRGAVWQTNSSFVYSEQLNNTQPLALTQANLSGVTAGLGTIPDGSDLVAAGQSAVLYLQANGDVQTLRSLSTTTHQSTTTLDGVLDVLAANSDGSVLAITRSNKTYASENPRGILVLYDQPTRKPQTIASDFRGKAAWGAAKDQWLAIGLNTDDQQIAYSGTGTKSTSFGFQLRDSRQSRNHLTPVGHATAGLLVTDTSGQLRFTGAKLPTKLPALPDTKIISGNTYRPDFDIHYLKAQGQYSVYISASPYQTSVQSTLKYLSNQGFDPYQLKLKWYTYDDVDPGFLLSPSEQPVTPAQTVPEFTDYLGD